MVPRAPHAGPTQHAGQMVFQVSTCPLFSQRVVVKASHTRTLSAMQPRAECLIKRSCLYSSPLVYKRSPSEFNLCREEKSITLYRKFRLNVARTNLIFDHKKEHTQIAQPGLH